MALSIRGGGFDTIRYWEIVASKTLLISEMPDIVIPHNFEHGVHAIFCRPDLKDLMGWVHRLRDISPSGNGWRRRPTDTCWPSTRRNTGLHICSICADGRYEEVPMKSVSLVIALYNQVDYTRRCIASIIECTPRPFELILIDNGCVDGTAE